MKNKKGFTIIEIVATFAILAVIMGIGVLSFNYVFNRVSDDYYHTIENSLLLSGNEYYQDHRDELPVNGYNKVAVKTLIDNHYIEPIKDKNGNLCTEGDVYIYPKEQGQYDYDVCLKCGDYESEGVYCNGDTESNHQIVIPTTIMCQLKMFSTYTGSPISLTKTSQTEGYAFSNNVQTGAGEYTITAKLKTGWKWSDNTENDRTIKCTLYKATPKIELTPNKGLVLIGRTRDFSEKVNTNGTITNTILNNNIIDATPLEKIITRNTESTVTVTGKSVGETKVKVTFMPNDTANYNIVDENSNGVKEFTIKASNGVTVPASPSDKTYTGKEQVHGIVIPEGVSIDESGSTISARNAGEYQVVLKLDDPENNAWSDGTTGPKVIKWKITKVDTVTTLSNVTRTYNGSRQGATEGGSILGSNTDATGGSYTYKYYTNSTCTQGETTNAPINAGTYYVKATLVGTENYNTSTSDCVRYTMNKKEISVSWGSTTTFVYNGNAQAPTVSIQTGVSGETMTLERTTEINAGNYTSTASCKSVTGGQGLCSNYTLKETTKAYTINPQTLTVPSSPSDKTYNGSSQNSGITCPKGSTAGGTQSATNVGTYTQTCTLTSTRNYKWSDNTTSVKSISWKINKAASSCSGKTVNYSGSSQNLVNTGSGCASYSNNNQTNAGSYTITCNGDANHNNSTCTGTINKVASSCSGKTVNYSGSSQNLVNTGSGCASYSNNNQTNAGSYTITCNGDANHNNSTCTGTINKVAAVLSCSNKNYTGSSQTACSCSGGTVGGTYAATNAGTYTASCTPDANHTAPANKSWTMNKVASSCSGKTVNYSGSSQNLVNTGSGCASYSNNNQTNAGSYTITCNGDANHNNSTCTGTINKVAAVLSCSNKNYTGSSQTACSCSGGTVGGTYAATNAGTYTASCTPDGNHTAPANKSWTMNKVASSCSGKTVNYSGSSQNLVNTGSGCASYSNNNQTNAGSYTITCNGDANHNNSTCTGTINKVAAVLSCSNKNYTGSSQTACSCSGGTVGGTYAATNAGTYTASCTPDGNHTAPANKSWTMNKIANGMSINSTSGTLTYGTNGTVTVTTNSDGVIKCSSSNTSVATCSVSGKTVTIIPQNITGDSKTATITITQDAGTNYLAASKTYAATVKPSDTEPPQCSLSVSVGGKITASATDNKGIAGKGFTTAYGGETEKNISSAGTYTYYVKDTSSNTNTCSINVVRQKRTKSCKKYNSDTDANVCGTNYQKVSTQRVCNKVKEKQWTGNHCENCTGICSHYDQCEMCCEVVQDYTWVEVEHCEDVDIYDYVPKTCEDEAFGCNIWNAYSSWSNVSSCTESSSSSIEVECRWA